MCERFSELRCKEVINITDGCRLGYTSDLELEDGRVRALIVPGPCRFLGLFAPTVEYVIPWCCIRRIGGDIILVDVNLEEVCRHKEKRGFFS